MPFSAQEQYAQLSDPLLHKVRLRLAEIAAYLPEGFSIRDDSTLAYNYAMQSPETHKLNAADVASELVFTQTLYNQSDYKTNVQSQLKECAEVIKKAYPFLNWTQVWFFAKSLVPAIKIVNFPHGESAANSDSS